MKLFKNINIEVLVINLSVIIISLGFAYFFIIGVKEIINSIKITL